MNINDSMAHLASLLTPDGAGNVILANRPAQFDSSGKLADTGFVQRSLGSKAGTYSTNVSATLDATETGYMVVFYGSTANRTLTLPAASALKSGAGYYIVNQGSVSVQVAAGGTDSINMNTPLGVTPGSALTVGPGDSVYLASNGGAVWNSYGWTTPNMFASSLSGSGYQKLPSGLILQWGSGGSIAAGSAITVSFPVAFPNAVFSITANPQQNNNTTTAVGVGITSTPSLSSFTAYNESSTGPIALYWFALGK